MGETEKRTEIVFLTQSKSFFLIFIGTVLILFFPTILKGEFNLSKRLSQISDNIGKVIDLNNTHGHISASFDSLTKKFNLGGGIKIEFQPLYQSQKKVVFQGYGSTEEKPTPVPFIPPKNRLQKHHPIRTNSNWNYLQRKGAVIGATYQLKVGIPYLRYKGKVVGGIANRFEIKRGPATFLSLLDIALIGFISRTHWLNRLTVDKRVGDIQTGWYWLLDWFPFSGNWETATGIHFSDINFTSLQSGAEISISEEDQRLKYRCYFRYLPPPYFLREIGGEIFGYTHTSPTIYGYKFYITLQWTIWKQLIVALTPYILFSKEYGFDPKIAVYFFFDYRF